MAGIAGLICLQERCGGGHDRLIAGMGRALGHRGELVGELAADGNLGALIRARPDADAAGVAASSSGRHVALLDGRLYNAEMLRSELSARGLPAAGASGAELVLLANEVWGAEAAGRLIGPFAAVVHDSKRRHAILFRDHYGSRPLVYAVHDGHLLFGSEVRTLLAAGVPRRLDERALVRWCLFQDITPPDTLFDGILALPPGHYLEITDGARPLEPRSYQHPAACVDPDLYRWADSSPDRVVLDRLDTRLRDSVLDALPGAGTVAVMLSGGVDSSIVAAIAAREEGLLAYHLSASGDPAMDERLQARSVARRLAIELEVLEIDEAGFCDELAEATWINELPLWHCQCVPFRLIAQRAGHDGATTVLTGDMLDGLFGLAGRHKALRWLLRARRLDERLPGSLRLALLKLVSEQEGLSVRAPRFVSGVPLALQLADRFAHTELQRECEESYGFVASETVRGILGGRLADLIQWGHRFQHRGDRLCGAAALEYRNPYQDLRLTSLTMNLPLRFLQRRRRGKWALRRLAERYLPEQEAGRRKVAWNLPVEAYLAPLARLRLFKNGFCADFLKLPAAALSRAMAERGRRFSTYYNLVQLEVWGRLYFVGQSLDEVRALLASVAGGTGLG